MKIFLQNLFLKEGQSLTVFVIIVIEVDVTGILTRCILREVLTARIVGLYSLEKEGTKR